MASRIQTILPRPSRWALARPALGAELRARVAALPGAVVRRPPSGPALWRLLWRLLWLPFWFGSDVAAPQLPTRERRPPVSAGLAGEQVIRDLTSLRRRIWLQRTINVLFRSAWLALAVGVGWLVVELSGGPALEIEALYWVEGVALLLGVIFAVLVRPTRRQVARMLDRSFYLHERMSTAVGNLGRAVPRDGERASVVYLQMADAANVIADLRRHRVFAVRPPVREMVLAIACGLLLASLYFLRGVGGGIPSLAEGVVPAFTPASERMAARTNPAALGQTGELEAPSVAEVEQRAQRSSEAQRDLQTLGQALDDHAMTHAAAEDIQSGDYPSAAAELENVGENADQMSQEDRNGLANDLDQAADQMSPGNEELANATRGAADGLREGGEAAEQGMQELGEAVEETGSEVASQAELAEQMRQAQAAEASGESSSSGEQAEGNSGEQGAEGSEGQAEAGEPGSEGFEGASSESSDTGGQVDDGSQGESSEGSGENPGAQPGEGGSPSDQGSALDPMMQPGGEGGMPLGDPPLGGPEGSNPVGDQSQQGAGAGSGEEMPGDNAPGAAQPGEQGGAEGAPAEAEVTDGTGSEGGESGEAPDTSQVLQLERQGGEGVQTSSDSGSSSIGSGTGVTAGGGTAVQGAVGEAGPDSNRVPSEYHDEVERYFTDPSEGS